MDELRRACPKCGSTDVRRAKRHGLLDFLVRPLGFDPFRCKLCMRRFRDAREETVPVEKTVSSDDSR
jgi:hypothetical protein